MSNDLYRSFWRWHFYAGLIALPFLAWLAVTGGLYLFKPEIERAFYGGWVTLEQPRRALAAETLVAHTQRQTGGTVTQIELPASSGESWRMRVQVGDEARTAFVDPGTGLVLGTAAEGGIMKTVRDLHSLAITGSFGNALIEIAAGWAIVLVATGIILWWPRGRNPILALRGPTSSRRFWRDLHSGTGVLAGAIVLFLAVTGMPWSVYWGANVQRMVAEHGLGQPKAPGPQPWEQGKGSGHEHGATAAQRASLPWALQAASPPTVRIGTDIGLDRAAAIASQHGISAPMTISLPRETSQPYSFSRVVQRSQDARALYIEPSSGRVLQDASYDHFGRGAQLIEWGIATHQGQEYGQVNRWIMLAGCLALLLLCVSAPILWWKRRSSGRLSSPPIPTDRKKGRAAAVLAATLGVLHPLLGASVLLVVLFDYVVLGRERKAII